MERVEHAHARILYRIELVNSITRRAHTQQKILVLVVRRGVNLWARCVKELCVYEYQKAHSHTQQSSAS